MKVFVSWSGSFSHQIALALKEWLGSVLQSVDCYVSSEDIDKGARWGSDISSELDTSDFGVLCVTPLNVRAPWLNFEAGALSKSFDKARVAPFLVGISRTDVPPGPILQFQSTVFEREDVRKLVKSMNATSGDQALDDSRLQNAFDVWWPKLEERLTQVLADHSADLEPVADASGAVTRSSDELLDEILELVRDQQRLLTAPELLFPAEYIERAFRTSAIEPSDDFYRALIELADNVIILVDVLIGENLFTSADVLRSLNQILAAIDYIFGRSGGGRYRIHSVLRRTAIKIREARIALETITPGADLSGT